MAVIDYIGASSARMVGLVALIPAWFAVQRYTLPHFTGGPLVLTVDALRATLYPILWITLAWLLLNPPTTRHFLYRREDLIWRLVFGLTYLVVIPFVFLTAIEIIRTYWLQTLWAGDLLLLLLGPTWVGFLLAFSLPGGYARNIAEERDAAFDETRHWSDETIEHTADREFTEELIRQGIPQADDAAERARWHQQVLDRRETQDELRNRNREAVQQNARRSVIKRIALAGIFLAIIATIIGAAAQSAEASRFMSRYLPMIIGVVLVAGFIIASVALSARRASPLSRAFRVVGLVVVFGLLINFVFFPASSNLLAGIYADFIADGVSSIEGIGRNWGQ